MLAFLCECCSFTTKERFCEAQAEAKCHDLIDEPEQRINEWIEEQKARSETHQARLARLSKHPSTFERVRVV